jgi:hypothetical protein
LLKGGFQYRPRRRVILTLLLKGGFQYRPRRRVIK